MNNYCCISNIIRILLIFQHTIDFSLERGRFPFLQHLDGSLIPLKQKEPMAKVASAIVGNALWKGEGTIRVPRIEIE